jgi:transposase
VTYTRSASLYRWPGTIVKGWPHPSQRMRGAAATTVRRPTPVHRHPGHLAASLTMTLQIVAKGDPRAFAVLPRRWVAERIFAWISKHQRTTRDHEHLPTNHEAMILWAMIALMTRRRAQTAQLSGIH